MKTRILLDIVTLCCALTAGSSAQDLGWEAPGDEVTGHIEENMPAEAAGATRMPSESAGSELRSDRLSTLIPLAATGMADAGIGQDAKTEPTTTGRPARFAVGVAGGGAVHDRMFAFYSSVSAVPAIRAHASVSFRRPPRAERTARRIDYRFERQSDPRGDRKVRVIITERENSDRRFFAGRAEVGNLPFRGRWRERNFATQGHDGSVQIDATLLSTSIGLSAENGFLCILFGPSFGFIRSARVDWRATSGDLAQAAAHSVKHNLHPTLFGGHLGVIAGRERLFMQLQLDTVKLRVRRPGFPTNSRDNGDIWNSRLSLLLGVRTGGM